MKLEEALKANQYVREHIDLMRVEEGYVILPAWQFVLLVHGYEEYRRSSIGWAILLMVAVLVLAGFPIVFR